MHERNPYKDGVDFLSLAESYPPLKPFLLETKEDGVSIDFRDSESQRKLTEALLARDFNLKVCLPEGRLCPPVPNRLNYVLWIQDLLGATFVSLATNESVIGVDIGTGASAIYPLLACSVEKQWQIMGTEVDTRSYTHALSNVSSNGLTDRISILKTTTEDKLLRPIFENRNVRFAFTMCNPPFYGSIEEVERSAEDKALGPNAVCTGAEVEMITPGGEAAFVRRIIEESLILRERCKWYTSMLGKLSSLGDVVESLRLHNIDNYVVTELTQGQTRRWVVGWSFCDARVPDSISRNLPTAHHALLPLPSCLSQTYSTETPPFRIQATLEDVLRGIEGVDFGPMEMNAGGDADFALRVQAASNTWSRAARRRAKQSSDAATRALTSEGQPHPPALIALIRNTPKLRRKSTALECIWIRGRDRATFESFWNHVSRKVGTAFENANTER